LATPSTLLKVMIDAARKAAKGLTRDFGELANLQVSKKGLADYVSAADIKAETALFEALEKVRPGYGFLGEERGMVEGTDKTHTWICDPLDGTTNFLHAIPHFAVNLALEREGQIVAAVTYNPATGDLYWAEKG
jgi:myo-inositol-1(or 4)-monophosphatase